MTRESHGPDPCNGSLKCQDFHDSLGRQVGTGSGEVTPLGGIYNCCCCDPCRFVRPSPFTDEDDERYYCCRCVPRVIFLKFVPNDLDANCCKVIGLPLFAEAGDPGSYLTTYQGSMLGLTVYVEVGRLTGTGTGTALGCGWRFTATINGTGSGTGEIEIYSIDHDDPSCLYVPEGMNLGSVEGPNGCSGYLTVEDVYKVKLPFQERYVTENWIGPNYIDISNDPSGQCTEVCARVCVAGIRHAGGNYERVEFDWFDDDITGTGTAADRGWSYDNGSYVEKLLLSHGGTDAVITPEFEGGAEIFSPKTVSSTTRCSCDMKEIITGSFGGSSYTATIRCGFCTCWEYVCGTCRCVPYSLCVMLYDGSQMWDNLQAYWNETDKSWDVASTETGTGYTNLLRLYLVDENGQCVIKPALYDGDVLTMNSYPVYDCGAETVTGQFTGQHDIVTISVEDQDTILTGTGTDTGLILIIASSLQPNCETGPCQEATPCYDDCDSHPDSLWVEIKQWCEAGDWSGGYYFEGVLSVKVYYWQTIDYLETSPLRPKYSCGYIGYGQLCGDCRVKVELRNGMIYIDGAPSGCTGVSYSEWELTTETCDPYYGQTTEDAGSAGPINHVCLGLVDDTCRTQITVTE